MKMKLLPTCLVCLLLVVFAFSCGQQSASEQPPENSAQHESSNPQTEGRVVPVEAMVMKYKNIEENIPLTGILRPIRSVDIVAEVSGKITKIVKSLGEKVSPRDTLAFIDEVSSDDALFTGVCDCHGADGNRRAERHRPRSGIRRGRQTRNRAREGRCR